MLEILGSLFGGGLTGLIGSGISKFVEYKKQKLADAHEIKMAEQERETMRLEHEGVLKLAITEGDIKRDIEDSKIFAASHDSDRATYLTGKVEGNWFTTLAFTAIDTLRGSVRPLITFYIAVVQTWMAMKLYEVAREAGGIQPDQAFELLNHMLASFLYIGTTVILWWFGTRNKEPVKKIF